MPFAFSGAAPAGMAKKNIPSISTPRFRHFCLIFDKSRLIYLRLPANVDRMHSAANSNCRTAPLHGRRQTALVN